MNKILAIFDFDGTITSRDTFNDFIIYNFGLKKFILVLLFISPLILLYLFRLVKNDLSKQIIFFIFFKGMSFSKYKNICNKYARSRLIKFIKLDAKKKIDWHIKCKHILIINSASLFHWIEPWALKNGFKYVIATNIEIKNNLLTGKFDGPCPYGIEKVNRFNKLGFIKNEYTLYVYGDSSGDKKLLEMADYPFFRSFN